MSLKRKIGCWVGERWRTELALAMPWICSPNSLANRRESLSRGETKDSWICNWTDSSVLTVARVFPRVGGRLLRASFNRCPAGRFYESAAGSGEAAGLTYILPVGGRDRVDQFLAVLNCLRARQGVPLEIVVIEQGARSLYECLCPADVTYRFQKIDEGNAFNKSRAINEGVDAASTRYVVVHDADIVVPDNYSIELMWRLGNGWQAVRPIRYIFHLTKADSESFVNAQGRKLPGCVAEVQQHNPGISTAIDKAAYWSIGGHDERFEGWGGEDNEFLDRLGCLDRVHWGGYSSVIHLWHPAAPKKANADRNRELTNAVRSIPSEDRIERLIKKT